MSGVKLTDLRDLAVLCRENSMRFEGFRQNALVSSLEWPDDVVEQFLLLVAALSLAQREGHLAIIDVQQSKHG
jgi:hypothetical protein